MKHFNAGNVWGRVAEVKHEESEKGTPYLSIQVECPSDLYGNIKTYGRLWGRQRIDAFMQHHKDHPGAAYRFRGFFSQYEKKDRVYSNYTFFDWAAVEAPEFRAAFVLVGTVLSIDNVGGDIEIEVVREAQSGYDETREVFAVRLFDPHEMEALRQGDTVQVKGVLRAKEAEDYFGMPSGNIRPYVMELKNRAGAGEMEPF